jgi:CRISPR-associated protein Csx10
MSKLTITMLSDWHIGSGTGRPGSVDRLIQRDGDNLPYIPAKTLTGILRDACELVAMGLDNGAVGVWHRYLEYLFGSQPAIAKGVIEHKPISAALSLRSAYFPQVLKKALKNQQELISALSFVKPGVSIDYESGTAKTDYLRFEEMVRGGSYLEAEYELNTIGLTEMQIQFLTALLVAGAAMVERVGAKRRRGSGKCQINLTGLNLQESLEHLKEEPPKIEISALTSETLPVKADDIEGWYTVELQLITLSPLVIHSRTLGNLVSTLDYIPGTTLLPIIMKQLRAVANVGNAIANNQIIIGNATPEIDGQQGRAMPFALFQEKQNDQEIYNRLDQSTSQSELDNRPQLKGMRSGYTSTSTYATISKGVATHNTVEDSVQRPNEDVGGVYSYEAIPSQTPFRAKIHIQHQLISKTIAGKSLQSLTGTCHQIGRSKKDSYGLVEIKTIDFPVPAQPVVSNVSELRVWLLSDILIRNSRLRPSTDPKDFAQMLGDRLKVKLSLKPDHISALARSHRTDSWQTRWDLPRPSLVGLSAGSCFLFTVTGNIDWSLIAELERIGLGERTVEGYGQICFNTPLIMQEKPSLAKSSPGKPSRVVRSLIEEQQPPEIRDYAQIVEKEAWRQEIRRQAVSLAASPEQRLALLGIASDRTKPTMSQLGVLRSLVMNDLKAEPGENSWVRAWVEHTNFQEKWPHDSLAKIRNLLTLPDHLWLFLASDPYQFPFERLTLTQNGIPALKRELWRETVQILILSCIRAHKRDLEAHKQDLEKEVQ